jgi:hypothetical protein
LGWGLAYSPWYYPYGGYDPYYYDPYYAGYYGGYYPPVPVVGGVGIGIGIGGGWRHFGR